MTTEIPQSWLDGDLAEKVAGQPEPLRSPGGIALLQSDEQKVQALMDAAGGLAKGETTEAINLLMSAVANLHARHHVYKGRFQEWAFVSIMCERFRRVILQTVKLYRRHHGLS